MKRVVITHKEMGIFLGEAMGMAFWSMLDAAGQYLAPTFEDDEDARDLVRSWVPLQDPDHYTYVELHSVNEWATIAELDKAGLSGFTALMLFNSPVVGGIH